MSTFQVERKITAKLRKHVLAELSMADLQFLHLGIKGNGRFDEKDIEQSKLKKMGVGRILDQLGSLKERYLIEINKDGSFSITDFAKNMLWNDAIPLWVNILRLLEISSQSMEDAILFLGKPPAQIKNEIEDLRKKQMVLMSPLRSDTGIMKMYEILPEGVELLKRTQSEGFDINPGLPQPQVEILSIIEEAIEDIGSIQGISDEKQKKMITNLSKIKEMLKI